MDGQVPSTRTAHLFVPQLRHALSLSPGQEGKRTPFGQVPNLFLAKGIEMKIYVGNLAPQTSEETLQAAFAAFGEVSSVAIITDRFTSQSRGFGFIEMPDRAQAQAAIAGMNSKALDGNTLTVSEAKPREPRAGGGGGGGGYGGGRGGGGGGYGGGRGGGGGGYGGGRSSGGGGGTHTGRRRSY